MNSRHVREWLRASALMAGATVVLGANAQEVVQTLDQVKAYGANDVVDMTFHDAYREGPYTTPASPINSASPFIACKQTSAAGLICLTADERIVNWPDAKDGGSRTELFSCDDINNILDVRASNTCTGVTADELGAIWLAGKNKGKSHSLVKVMAGACPGGATGPRQEFTSSLSGTKYCAQEWDTGRPLLLSVKRVEGQLAERFDDLGSPTGGDTVIGLEQRLNAVIFSATVPQTYYEVPGGKSGWGLGRKEDLQDISLLQSADGVGGYFNYVLVTTSDGRVMAKDMANPSGVAYPVRTAADRTCQGTGTLLSLAASPKGEVIYLSDSACADVVALKALRQDGKLVLSTVTERYVDASGTSYPVVEPLSTSPYAPVGVTVAPGQDFQLDDCGGGDSETGGCSPVAGARLFNLDFVDGVAVDSGVTVLQIINLPDCRWLMSDENDVPWPIPAECTAETLYDPDGVGDPAGEFLNIEPLLPREVRDVLEAKKVWMPDRLLIAPQHRAQYRNEFRFDALFFIVDESVKFTGIFETEFDPKLLTINQLESRCEGTTGLDWDIVTKVSEQRRYISVDGRYQDMLLNTGCGSSRGSTISLSVYSFPLEITPDTYIKEQDGVRVVRDNDAVFARYMEKLFHDLDYVARQYACNVGNNPEYGYPVSALQCSTLLSALNNAGDKLGKCIEATYQPKQSSGNQNCTAFLQQWATVKTSIDSIIAADAGRDDPANRRYELKQRAQVFDHVYDTRFWPSVPPGGFCSETGCP